MKVNGNDATFMWDNGFSVSGIDQSLADDFSFIPFRQDDKFNATDGNNVTVNLGALICPELEIEGIILSNTPFVKLDFRVITMTKALKIEGVLGASIINKLNWKFDFDNHYVEISKKPFAVKSATIVLPYKITEANNTHIMPITLNDSKTDCLVDFGYNSNIIEINASNAKFFSGTNAAKTIGPSSISVSGVGPVDTIYTIKENFSWALSGKKLTVKPNISFTKATHHITVGNKLFRDNYNVIINTTARTVYALSPRTDPVAPPTDKVYGYKLLIIDGIFKIMSIDSNINTINSDVKLLDEVVSVNGKMPADFEDNYTFRKYQKDLQEQQAEMVLRFKDGKELLLSPQTNIEYKL